MMQPFLIGEKIYLRPILPEDADFICRGENDPRVRESLFLSFPTDPVRQKEKILSQLAARDNIIFTIAEKNGDSTVGQTAFFRLDWVSRATVFYLAILDAESWHKGYGLEATRLMVDYAFATLNLHRIQLHVFAENLPAIKIYQKVGFIKEGVLREAMFHHDRYCDFWVMGLLREDWLKLQYKSREA